MKINQRCSCGKLHTKLPTAFKVQQSETGFDPLDGIYFDCECHSTLFIPGTIQACDPCLGAGKVLVTVERAKVFARRTCTACEGLGFSGVNLQ